LCASSRLEQFSGAVRLRGGACRRDCMAKSTHPERSSAEVLSEADRRLAELQAQVEAAKREKRRAKRLRRQLAAPKPETDEP
jgi:hypothetical protein